MTANIPTDEELPALPKPWDYVYIWDGPYGAHKLSIDRHNGRKCDRSEAVFTADQLRAAQREAFALGAAQNHPATFDLTEARTIVADAIRQLRAAHVDCNRLTMMAEDFLEATNAAAKSDELWTQTLEDRDRYHETADKLAQAIAKHFDTDIGEHSSANCPWEQALDVMAAQPAAPVVAAEPVAKQTNKALRKIFDYAWTCGASSAMSELEGRAHRDFKAATFKKFAEACAASPPPAAPAVPPGMALVTSPITEEMHVAAVKVLHRASGLDGLPQRMLDAMHSAGPQQTKEPPC